jgi:hypothetical protein
MSEMGRNSSIHTTIFKSPENEGGMFLRSRAPMAFTSVT